ncbi:SGNH/GDSL hydrolase family protein [Flavivirga algicola]|uniref:SGNH/GDSL hydrolase family protein n=1 Tax=Flavivirga algicola TaxID=2729136 RepID=A0ABX1RXC2_9FLAO|nr:SGNH/GDSL hydrolase family protein [Flavivirga algicola]NMH87052.1 SGNH/GDSL hydrolase family protein [Flavivirga algicola]
MTLKTSLLCLGIFTIVWFSCSSSDVDKLSDEEIDSEIPKDDSHEDTIIKIISLGDSYTIGESVCDTCKFPEQLKDSIIKKIGKNNVTLKVIAQTGWTTTFLKDAIEKENLIEDYDLVTLLIGVNNQFQRKPFSLFEEEFPQLVNTAIKLTKLNKEKLIVVSIPDYAFTPFGNGNTNISEDLDKYNTYIENYCKQYSITYVYITDITREGFQKPELVANDGLHPSTIAYSHFVSRMLPKALEKIGYNTN